MASLFFGKQKEKSKQNPNFGSGDSDYGCLDNIFLTIWIAGPPSSGKTSLVNSLVSQKFDPNVSPTVKSSLTQLNIKSHQIGIFDFVNPTDPEKQSRKPSVIIFTFDVQNPLSLQDLEQSYLPKFGNNYNKIIVGTKGDSQISFDGSIKQNGEKLALLHQSQFFMVSSKDQVGIDQIIQIIVDLIDQQENALRRMRKRSNVCHKPVIYFYPPEITEVKANLVLHGKLLHSYPNPHKIRETEGLNDMEWEIVAKPNGEIINKENKKLYNYIFWEGTQNTTYDFSKGFIVEGKNIVDFLEEKLEILGLNRKEITDFITFWMPHLENNKFNLISFQKERYTDAAELKITPKPDTLIRVYMGIRKVNENLNIEEQNLEEMRIKRKDLEGFTVVEWGGGFH